MNHNYPFACNCPSCETVLTNSVDGKNVNASVFPHAVILCPECMTPLVFDNDLQLAVYTPVSVAEKDMLAKVAADVTMEQVLGNVV